MLMTPMFDSLSEDFDLIQSARFLLKHSHLIFAFGLSARALSAASMETTVFPVPAAPENMTLGFVEI